MWQLKTQILTKLKNSKTRTKLKTKNVTCQRLNCDKTQNVTKLKKSSSDKTQKLKLWQNSNSYKAQELKLWPNLRT